MSCDCNTPVISICDPCNNDTGCPLQLDANCVIYHKANSEISELTNLNIQNGATLELILETIDASLAGLQVPSWNLPCLRASHTINTIRQFAEIVDTQICLINSDIAALQALVNLPITAVDTNSVDLTTSGTNNHTLRADVKISSTAHNLLSVLSDGLFAAPQTLSVNYTTKELSISDGNTVSLAGLACGVGGFLGNLSSDPSAILDGQYWYNITSDNLKIRLNGITRTITII